MPVPATTLVHGLDGADVPVPNVPLGQNLSRIGDGRTARPLEEAVASKVAGDRYGGSNAATAASADGAKSGEFEPTDRWWRG